MRKPVILITGASGEIGHGLIEKLAADGGTSIITIDLQPLPREHRDLVDREYLGSILEIHLLERILAEFEVRTVYHLAALLSTRAEFTPLAGHQVNVEGTLKLLDFAQSQGESHGHPVVFLYPSSIAAYGLPDLERKNHAGRVSEHEWNQPTTMYGCNKLYCEHLGRYYADNYKQLAAEPLSGKVDFRAIRFPGLISAVTVPSGGTSDYAPEMIHAAAQGQPYACFVRPDARIPFMTMPDAVDAMLALASADADNLTRSVYNITAFNPSAGEISELVKCGFPDAEITFEPDLKRQAIIDSWPADVDDSAARRDWGLRPAFDLDRAFTDYLIPRISERYRS
ncbi:MAG: NAD-dependent epimerase/dehydratase family protein [Thermoanaerobaculales bacterium]|jgi:nucleoside-diphosphate-sugar epimerase|nr:NAD-dependent epimerase/dehydratase family protein [Thermoanaerobaculales bacterium]